MFPIVAIAGPTHSGKTQLAVSLAREVGATLVPLDQLQRYRELDRAVGFDHQLMATVRHEGYHLLSPWEVSPPPAYVAWLDGAIAELAVRGPVIIEGGCTSYLFELLAARNRGKHLERVRVLALEGQDDRVKLERDLAEVYSDDEIESNVEEIATLEKLGYISRSGTEFLISCEGMFKHPEHPDRRLAWALRIAAKVYGPAYLMLQGKIGRPEARIRTIRNVTEIHVYQQLRIRVCSGLDCRVPASDPSRASDVILGWLATPG